MPLIHGERDPLLDCRPVVQVPAPLTADEARQILADHRPWVEVTGDAIDIPLGARVREEYVNGETSPTVYIHPDDVPDPDADLIDDLAHSLAEAWERTELWDEGQDFRYHPDTAWTELARVAIERVRAGA